MKLFFRKKKAPELVGLDDAKKWINSEPLSLERLKGKVLLLDFWTYSCINCIRTLPALKEMWEKYKNKRFVIVGIHTPEFEFEKEIGNVKYAVKKYGISYPIFNDLERRNWNNYGNQYWPRAALINSEGEVIFDHIGESGYEEIEEKIVDELFKIKELKEGEVKLINEVKKVYESGISKESYIGSLRNNGFNSRVVCKPGSCNKYIDIGRYEKDKINLQGQWDVEKEFAEFNGPDRDKSWIGIKFYSTEVNIVMSGIGTAEVLLDGNPLSKRNAGKNMSFIGKKSYLKVDGSDIYNVFDNKGTYIDGILKIIPFRRMRAYAFTFG